MILVQKYLNDNMETETVEKFIRYDRLGEKLAYNLCLGREVIIELFDRLGNGQILINEKNGDNITFIEFKEIKVEDIVTIEFNKLGIVKRLYK